MVAPTVISKSFIRFLKEYCVPVSSSRSDINRFQAQEMRLSISRLWHESNDICLPKYLTDAEYDELVEYVKGKWNYDEENLDWIVDTAIEAGRGLMMMINMQKS